MYRCTEQAPPLGRSPPMSTLKNVNLEALLLALSVLVCAPAAGAEPGDAASVGSAHLVRVAAVQCPSDLGQTARNTAKLSELIRQAAQKGARIIVLPEAAVSGYLSQDLKTNWHVPGR